MPIGIYTAIHREAVVSGAELATLRQWAGFGNGSQGRGYHDEDDD